MNKLEFGRSSPTCHAEFSSGSHKILNRAALVQNDIVYQQGRSMVEILGVLAVMGVISVTGIITYNNVMNKHRANELLNKATKRAVVVAGQFLNRNTASLAEFSEHSSFYETTFNDEGEIKIENKRFKIMANNVSPKICKELKNLVGKETSVRNIACDITQVSTAVFWFNFDLSINDPQGDLCDESKGLYCEYDQICTTSGQIAGICLDKDDSFECFNNSDCEEQCGDKNKCFCHLFGDKNNKHFSEGKCEKLEEGKYLKANLIDEKGNVIFEKGKLLQGPTGMNYFSARNYCKGYGKELVDISHNRLQCHDPEAGYFKRGYCTAQGVEAYETPADRSFIVKQLSDSSITGFSMSRFWTKFSGVDFYLPSGYFYTDNMYYPYAFTPLCE